MLHITNGDAAGGKLEASGLPGRVLPWRDVLHEGPVPAGVSDERLHDLRARYLADLGAGPYERVRAAFAEREVTLATAIEGDGIVLWFEHDLYDQLQLVQLLAWLAERPGAAERVSLVCIDRHPEIERFIGLGQLSPAQMAALFPAREPVTPAQLELARAAWSAFRSPVPTAIEELVRGDTAALPFLAPALRRHLEQFPAVGTGVSRTEMQLLEVVAAGVKRFDRIFVATQDLEDAPFLGDSTVWAYLRGLAAGERPLLRAADGAPLGGPGSAVEREREVELTGWGGAVRRREADWLELSGGMDRWLGGVRLVGREPEWRWNPRAELLVRRGDPTPAP